MGFLIRFGPAIGPLLFFAGTAMVSAATGEPVSDAALGIGLGLAGFLFLAEHIARRRFDGRDKPVPPQDVRVVLPWREIPVELVYDGVEYQRMHRWRSAYPVDVGPDIEGMRVEGMCPPHTLIRVGLVGHPEQPTLG